jgi:hypothetical protein
MNYSGYKTAPAIPEASSMIETFRAIGYSLETAIADIIDNSISALAKNVWVSFNWKGNETWLSIKDDGRGMTNDEIIRAMRPGTKNPRETRSAKDLGRFGLGLKTASFSQCRTVSVLSKAQNGHPSFWTWDLDFVNQTGQWNLVNYLPEEQRFQTELVALRSGTIVVWNDIDRLVRNLQQTDIQALDRFLVIMEQVKKHLAMVFHRFIETGRLKIHFQNRIVSAWSPFLINDPATQGFPEEPLHDGRVTMKGYVLPHKSKLNEEAFKEAEGPKGWNEQQGFYIYRNDRMLLAGDWFGLFRKEEHYKLSRIQLNLPNDLDSEWQIDIKKSIARPPIMLREQLKAYASQVRSRAVQVYRHRGKNVRRLPGQQFIPLWIDHKRGSKWFYKVNRQHPLLGRIRELAIGKPDKAIEMLISFIEETIPTKSIYIKEAENSDGLGNPFEGIDQEPIRKVMKQIYDNLISAGKTDEAAKAFIANIEPFNHFPEFLETIG